MSADGDVYYFDSSVLLRYAINHTAAIRDLARFSKGATSSVVTTIECLRVLDRWRITKEISDDKLVAARSLCLKLLSGLRMMALDDNVVQLASQSFPIALKSLDAIHLASALLLQKQLDKTVCILTHDAKLSLAAEAMNLGVVST